MRRLCVLTLPVLLLLPGAEAGARAETTREIRAELTAAEAARFAVENLAGTMTIGPGQGAGVLAIATVHAESDDLARAVRFERVEGDGETIPAGVPTLRVRYPLDRQRAIRFAGEPGGERSFLGCLFGGSGTRVRYDGQKAIVSGHEGPLLYADVEVRVPAREVEATFRNAVGALRARGVSGTIRFDSHSGDQTLETIKGTIVADTGSGDVEATDLEGSLRCDTGSGDCRITGFRGQDLTCDTGSGDVTVRAATARRLRGDTGSGGVRALDADLEEFIADTGSGDVELQAKSVARLKKVKADTGSGDVTLRLGPDASFEAVADQGSGDISNRYADAQPILKGKELIGWRRGSGTIRISVDTGSGDLTLEPGRVSEDRGRSKRPGSNPTR